MYKYTTKSP